MSDIRIGVTYAGYRAKDVVAINDRTHQAVIRATGGGFIRRESRPDLKSYGFALHPHRKLGAALKAAGFRPREIETVLAAQPDPIIAHERDGWRSREDF